MPTPAQMVLPKGKSADEFEDICRDVLSDEYKMKFERYGRNGQKQNGIDLYCKNDDGSFLVAQCKNYCNENSAERLIKKIEKDFADAEQLSGFCFKSFIVMTSMDRDVAVQNTFKNCRKIEIIFWDEIQEAICKNQNLLKKHYPTIHSIDDYFELSFSVGEIITPGNNWALTNDRVLRGQMENDSGNVTKLNYELNITNKNDIAVMINKVYIDVINFIEEPDIVYVSSPVPMVFGPQFCQLYSGNISSSLKKYLLSYQGENRFENGQAKFYKPDYLRVEAKQSEHISLMLDFNNTKSGIYQFRINVDYIRDGVDIVYQSDICEYLHDVNISSRVNIFCDFYDESLRFFENIFYKCFDGTISNDEYKLLRGFVDERIKNEMIVE